MMCVCVLKYDEYLLQKIVKFINLKISCKVNKHEIF